MSGFDEGMMVLTIKNESIGRTSDLLFLGSLSFRLLSSRNDAVVSEKIARGRDLNHTTIDIFNCCHWRLNHVANREIKKKPKARIWNGSYRRRVAIMVIPLSPIMFLRVMGTSIEIEPPELMF